VRKWLESQSECFPSSFLMIPDPFHRKVEDYGPLVWTKANWETSFPDTFRQYKEAWDHLKKK
jgi:hypothetical protein